MPNLTGENQCILPEGDYLNSCNILSFEEYHSSDRYVPVMCKLKTTCDSFSNYRPDVENEIYLPQNTIFKNLNNVNGVLSYGNSPLFINAANTDIESFDLALAALKSKDIKAIEAKNEKIEQLGISLAVEAAKEANKFLAGKGADLISTDPFYAPRLIGAPEIHSTKAYEFKDCSKLAGSYANSCDIKTSQYLSTDIKLEHTELCEIKVECLAANGISRVFSSTVYSNINEKADATTVQFLENCDGKIVIGNLDNQCSKSGANLKDLSSKGKSGKILR